MNLGGDVGFNLMTRNIFLQFAVRIARGYCVLAALSMVGSMVPFASTAESAEGISEETFTRRLTPAQYKTIIADVFGRDIKIGGRFDPGVRVDGLLEVGAGQVSISPAGMEQYDSMARSIANQVVDERHRNILVRCQPKSKDGPDDACARQFLGEVGQLLYRRPLTGPELGLQVFAAREATRIEKDFYKGIGLSLAGMLSQPQFLFRQETLEPDPARPGEFRLDAYSRASRLSFFLWNSGPDKKLLTAARNGELDTQDGLAHQVERMSSSSRLEASVRAFFSDMFQFNKFEALIKDTEIYPKYSSHVAQDAREQTLKTVADLLLTQQGDYRDIFTTKKTFLTKTLASVYQVPFTVPVPNGSPDAWGPYEFLPEDPRAGILTQISFVSLHSHPGRSSPTLRGKALREVMLCQKVPSPPGDVDFTLVQDTGSQEYKTTRARLTAHATQPVCAGCHKITDPMGLALENFDGSGGWQTTENGAEIDASGTLDDVEFNGGGGLGQAVHDNPATTSCLVNRLAAYALGRTPIRGETPWVAGLERSFAEKGYGLPALMQEIATSPELYRASASKTEDVTMLVAPDRFQKEGE
jgi:hypothetical protein